MLTKDDADMFVLDVGVVLRTGDRWVALLVNEFLMVKFREILLPLETLAVIGLALFVKFPVTIPSTLDDVLDVVLTGLIGLVGTLGVGVMKTIIVVVLDRLVAFLCLEALDAMEGFHDNVWVSVILLGSTGSLAYEGSPSSQMEETAE